MTEGKIIFGKDKITKGDVIKDFELSNTRSFDDFLSNINFKILSKNKNDLEMQITGMDAPLINSLRRNMLCEIPTMAIDKVIMYQNTSVIPDEVLAKSLGLLPVKANPDLYNFQEKRNIYNENNSIKFKLHVKCTIKDEYKGYKHEELNKMDPKIYLNNYEVTSKDLTLVGFNSDTELNYKESPKILYDNILLAKLRQNQEIELEVVCKKDSGKSHSKFSPVATAYYRLYPFIEIKKKIVPKDIEDAVNLCPMGVFSKDKNSKELIVKYPENCTMCRNCINDSKLGDHFELGKLKDNYIFTIESVGVLDPYDIFIKSLKALKDKAIKNLNNLKMAIKS